MPQVCSQIHTAKLPDQQRLMEEVTELSTYIQLQ